MHCYDQDFSVFSLLPLFNVAHGQVVNKETGKLMTDSDVRLTYEATPVPSGYNPVGSINTTSIGKTNFWTYLVQLFGVSQLPDMGILGYKMPGALNTPQALAPYDATYKWFSATGIPVTNIDDNGIINCFSMMKIKAFDQGTDTLRSSLDIVVPSSSEMNCISCHETAAKANNVTTFSDASPPPRLTTLTADSFSMVEDANIRFRINILILHDALSGTNLVGQYDNGKGSPILCAQCHYSKALDLAGNNQPTGDQRGHLYLSRAIHKHHGTAWPTGSGGMGGGMAGGGYTVPIPGTGAAQCYYCHPGNETQCLRSVMAVKGMQCQSCHGSLLAVAGFTPQLALPHGVDRLPTDPALLTVNLKSTGAQRRPWVDMPKCQSCHTGDAVNHLGAKIVGTQAYAPQDAATASPILAPNSRFAENKDTLYRFSSTHGGMACESCHGSPHSEWPARTDSLDNITATQIQGHTGEIAECGSCHAGDLTQGLNGPHGLHGVNDQIWAASSVAWPKSAHGALFKQDTAACKACHGLDLKGTVLSRAKAERNLTMAQSLGGGPITIPAATPVSCYACHKTLY